MKNILAENMRRFGTKNLNEIQIQIETYTVQQGDTLYDIAKNQILKIYNKTKPGYGKEEYEAIGLNNPSPQQILKFVTAIVKDQEALAKFMKSSGMSSDVLSVDTIKNPDLINSGQKLQLPSSWRGLYYEITGKELPKPKGTI